MTGPEQSSSTVADLSVVNLARQASGVGLAVKIGPFNAQIRTDVNELIEPLATLYADYPLIEQNDVFSFRIALERRRNFPRLHHSLVRFSVEGRLLHEDMPASQSLAVLEWGINLIIALRAHSFLMLHSAVLERDGVGLLLPAAPGSGKSTLSTALAHSGWRLLSDEFGLIRPGDTQFVAIPRPIALKNESIDVIRSFSNSVVLGPSISGTRKGTVAHVMPPASSVQRQAEVVAPKLVVFPRWEDGAELQLEPLTKSDGFMMVAMNAFNYELLGESGFHTVAEIVSASDCHRLVYSNLSDAISVIDSLANEF